MSGPELKQRLAAILAADVTGYSRLMAADDRSTVEALDAGRAVFRTHIEANQGHVIDMAGDSALAVLPFTNMSWDPEQDYFADGMVEDIIMTLARMGTIFVIARNSSFVYRSKAVDIKQVGRELGVCYVLEGSVRKAGNRVRITGQLIEAGTARHVWADRFEGMLEDVFELQDRITESVVAAIQPNMLRAEIERARVKPTSNLQAYDLLMRALPGLLPDFTVSRYVSVSPCKDAEWRKKCAEMYLAAGVPK